jgi:hypothetical protein
MQEQLDFIAFMLCLIAFVVIITMAKVIEIQNFLKKGKMKL